MYSRIRLAGEKRILALLVIAVMITVTAAPATAATQYQDPQGRFAFSLPNGWTMERSTGTNDGLWLTADGNAAITITHEAVRSGTTSVAYAESNVPTLVTLTDYTELDRRLVTANGAQQPFIQYTYTDDNGDQLGIAQIFIVANTTGWVLTLVQLSGNDSIAALNAFNVMATTFTLGTGASRPPVNAVNGAPARTNTVPNMSPPYAGMYSCSTGSGNFAGFFTLNDDSTYVFGPTNERGRYAYTVTGAFTFTTGEYARSYPSHTGTYRSPGQSTPGIITILPGDGATITCKLG